MRIVVGCSSLSVVCIMIQTFVDSDSDWKHSCLLRARPPTPPVLKHPPRCWWFSSGEVWVIRTLRVGYREVNQDQSSDPPALFGTSKAYSSLFSQYTLAAISAVSPDKALYIMCDSMYWGTFYTIHLRIYVTSSPTHTFWMDGSY